MWESSYKPGWASVNFKGIKSNYKDKFGNIIRSGQKVDVHGRINPLETCEVLFEPNHGFRVQGNSLADVTIIKVVEDVPWYVSLIGNLKFLFFSLVK